MFGYWVNSWLLGRFFVDFWPLVRFLALLDDFWVFWTIFVIWVDFWLLGKCLASESILAIGWIFGLWFDFWLFVRFFGLLDDFCHLG